MKRPFKILVYSILIALCLIKIVGCFTFRDSDKERNKTFDSAGYAASSKRVMVNDRVIHFIQTGLSDSLKPLICFVHGSPGASNNFNNNLLDSLLQSSFKMISIDRPGFGFSDFGYPMPSLKDQAAALSAVLKKFPNQSIILVGHSYGGPLIGQIAVDFPELVSGLIVVAGSIDPELEPKERWRKPASSAIGRWLLPSIMTVSNAEILTLKTDLSELKPHWRSLKIPVIVIQGERDKLVPSGNADFAERMLDSVAYLKIHRYAEFNHFIPFMNHHVITEAILEMDSVLNK